MAYGRVVAAAIEGGLDGGPELAAGIAVLSQHLPGHAGPLAILEKCNVGRVFALHSAVHGPSGSLMWRLQPGGSEGEAWQFELVDLEQFVEGFPGKTAQWVHCPRPASLEVVVMLAEIHKQHG